MPTCWSATLIVPLRTPGSPFVATLKEMLASPCPVAEPPSCIQPLAAAALHWHSRLVEMVSVPLPPAAENDVGVAAAETAHFTVEGDVTFWVEDSHAPAQAAATYTNKASTTRGIFGVDAPEKAQLCASYVQLYKNHSRAGRIFISWIANAGERLHGSSAEHFGLRTDRY